MESQNTVQNELPGIMSAGVTPSKDGRRRFQFKFWLDVTKDELYSLALELEELKQKRQFAPTIRNALRLFFDLKAGKLDVLGELFPNVVISLKDSQDSHEVQQFEALLEKHQRELLAQINANGTPPATMGSGGGPKKLTVPAFRTPSFSDSGEDEIVLKKDTSTEAGKNFLKSMMALQG